MSTKERTYTDLEIAEKLTGFEGWYYEDGFLRRQYKTDEESIANQCLTASVIPTTPVVASPPVRG